MYFRQPASSRSMALCAAGTPVSLKPAISTLKPLSLRPIAKSEVQLRRLFTKARLAAGITNPTAGLAAKIGNRVSASRWSVWLCDDVTTSIMSNRRGSITNSLTRRCSLSVWAYLTDNESDKYGSNSKCLPWYCTKNPLCPNHHTRNPADCSTLERMSVRSVWSF